MSESPETRLGFTRGARESEQELQTSERRLRQLADAMPQLVWMAESDGTVTYYNSQADRYGGIERSDGGAWEWHPVLHPEDRGPTLALWRRAIEQGVPYQAEHRVCMKGGGYRWHLSRARRLGEGSEARWFGTATDIHEIKLAQKALQEREEQLRQADRRKDEYLAMLGHELRNPLAAVRNASEVIKVLAGDDERLGRATAVLERQSEHMARLIDGLLEVSRIARGKLELHRQVVDLRSTCEQVVGDRQSAAAAAGLELIKVLPLAPMWVNADPVRVAQVVDNLLGNALKFTPAPGRATVTLDEDAGGARLRIQDTGIGMRPEELDRIFEPFHQLEQDLDRGTGGLGLGLALCKGLVELHEGHVEAASEGPGRGTEVTIHLPTSAPPEEGDARAPGRRRTCRRVLIVEDNQDAAQMLSDLLQLQGHDVAVTENGRDALSLLRQQALDVVLCDIGLPGIDGYEVARAVREDEGLRDIPLVAVTGYGQPEDQRRAHEAGFDAHLTKPVEIEALLAVLDELGAGLAAGPSTKDRPPAG